MIQDNQAEEKKERERESARETEVSRERGTSGWGVEGAGARRVERGDGSWWGGGTWVARGHVASAKALPEVNITLA
jgi:hypothetical protein